MPSMSVDGVPWWVFPVVASVVLVLCGIGGWKAEQEKRRKKQALRTSLLHQTSKPEMAGFRAAAVAAAAAEARQATPIDAPPPAAADEPDLPKVLVRQTGAKLRKGTGRFTPLVPSAEGGTLSVGDEVHVLQQTQDKKGLVWLKVKAVRSGAVGYLSETFTLEPQAMADVEAPEVDAPPSLADDQAVPPTIGEEETETDKAKAERKRKMEERFAAMAARQSFQVSALSESTDAAAPAASATGGMVGIDESTEVTPSPSSEPADGSVSDVAAVQAVEASAADTVVDASVEVSSTDEALRTAEAADAAAEGGGTSPSPKSSLAPKTLSPRQQAMAERFASLKQQFQEGGTVGTDEQNPRPRPPPPALSGSE